jgi:hypothetical protein
MANDEATVYRLAMRQRTRPARRDVGQIDAVDETCASPPLSTPFAAGWCWLAPSGCASARQPVCGLHQRGRPGASSWGVGERRKRETRAAKATRAIVSARRAGCPTRTAWPPAKMQVLKPSHMSTDGPTPATSPTTKKKSSQEKKHRHEGCLPAGATPPAEEDPRGASRVRLAKVPDGAAAERIAEDVGGQRHCPLR